MKGKGCLGKKVARLLVIIGALNWGIIGAFDYNLVGAILGSVSWLERSVYVLVGIGGILLLVGCPCKACKRGNNKNEKGSCCKS